MFLNTLIISRRIVFTQIIKLSFNFIILEVKQHPKYMYSLIQSLKFDVKSGSVLVKSKNCPSSLALRAFAASTISRHIFQSPLFSSLNPSTHFSRSDLTISIHLCLSRLVGFFCVDCVCHYFFYYIVGSPDIAVHSKRLL